MSWVMSKTPHRGYARPDYKGNDDDDDDDGDDDDGL